MPLRDPPLNAVRVFVAAARLQSFTQAAHELCVTHGAVSRQVRGLEHFLGVPLFERKVRQVRLTAAGRRFFAEVEPALEQIGSAARALQGPAEGRVVRINVRPSFALHWLIPRLPQFVARHPDIEPQVVTSTVAPAQVLDGFDIAVRRGLEGWPASLAVHPFLDDRAVVVAAPALLAARPLATPRALASHVWLAARTRPDDWADWCRQAGAPRLKGRGQLQFDHLHFVLQAAIDGMGVALAPVSILAHDLAAGRLASPWPERTLPIDRLYYALARRPTAEARCFAAWLEAMSRG